MEVKRCGSCREILPLTDFIQRRDNPSKYLPRCKACRKVEEQQKRAKSQAKAREKQALKRNTSTPMKRTPLRPVSKKRQEVNAKRRALLIAHFGNPKAWKCQIGLQIGTKCFGEVHAHEILSRSRAGRTDENLLDISNILLACDYHNGWVEDNPKKAHELGLAIHSWEAKRPKKDTAE